MTTVAERADAWNEVRELGRLLSAGGLTPGTTGNLSVRWGDGFLTSGTGTRLGALGDDDWAEVDLTGATRSTPGEGMRATKEAALHAGVYRIRPDVNAVVHLHSPAALAVSCLAPTHLGAGSAEPLPAYTPYYAMRVRGLRLVDAFTPGDPGLAAAVGSALAEADAALLRRHGIVTAGGTLAAAAAAAEELETNCDLHLRLWDRPVSALSAAEVTALRSRR